MDDAELEQVYRQGTARSGGTRVGCPSDEDLLQVLTGAATTREREAVADHLVGCSDCAEEYRIARELRPWAADAASQLAADRAVSQPSGFRATAFLAGPWRTPRFIFAWRFLATAVALVVLAVGGVALWQNMVVPPASDRGTSSMTLAVQPSDRAVLPVPPDRLSWSAVANAERYHVVLYDVESTPLWESPQSSDPHVSLPATVRRAIRPDRPYYWRVIVSTGVDRRTSEPFQFTVTAR